MSLTLELYLGAGFFIVGTLYLLVTKGSGEEVEVSSNSVRLTPVIVFLMLGVLFVGLSLNHIDVLTFLGK